MSVAADTDMLIGAPAEKPPEALIAALREAAATHPEIRSAYLFQLMILTEGEEPHLTLGLELDDSADLTPIGNDLGRRTVGILPEGSYLDVYPLAEDMVEAVAQSVEPLYERPS